MKKLSIQLSTMILVFGLMVGCNSSAKETGEKEKTNTEEFSEMSEEEGFADSHDEPKETNTDHIGEMITIPVEGGEDANVYRISQSENNSKYLFVIHEWWGLNDYVKNEADRLFNALGNVNVMALDLYDGKVATKREKAQEYMQGVDEARLQSIIDAAIAKVGPDAKIATIGWCFGGGWSLRTALRAGDQTQACVMYYGMPVQDVERLKGLNSDVLFIFGTQDEWINQEMADKFAMNMKEAGKEVTILPFDANHAFANPTQESFVESAAQEANAAALEYLKERM